MPRLLGLFLLSLGLWLALMHPPAGAADDDLYLQQALALQKVMQQIIRDVEPSIACILVSRRVPWFRGLTQPGWFTEDSQAAKP